MAIVLWQYEISPFCDKVRRVLRYKRQPFTTREVSLLETVTAIRSRNPAGKLPFVEREGERVCDSTDIALWAERTFPTPSLYPSDPAKRGLCHALEDWADESLYFLEMYLRFMLPHNAKKWVPVLSHADNAAMRALAPSLVPHVIAKRVKAQGLGTKSPETILRDLDRHIDAIAGMLDGGPYLLGDALTVADIAVFAQLFCIGGADEGASAIGKRAAVCAWMDRVDAATA
jgi:glutathione S-transferase